MAGNGKTCYFPDIGAGGWQTTEKSTKKRECLVLRHRHSLFKYKNKDYIMNKRRAIQVITKAAALYRDNLEDQKVLFLYGLPAEIKRELKTQNMFLSSIKGYEVAFHRYNFLHLTGVKLNKTKTVSAIHFYEKCLDKRLTENDFFLAKDGSTGQKLDILESMMSIKCLWFYQNIIQKKSIQLYQRLIKVLT